MEVAKGAEEASKRSRGSAKMRQEKAKRAAFRTPEVVQSGRRKEEPQAPRDDAGEQALEKEMEEFIRLAEKSWLQGVQSVEGS